MTAGPGAHRRAPSSTPPRQPFLHDHRIDGTPVLPGVMGMEAFAEAAPRPAARLAGRRARGRRAAGAVQVLPRRAAHAGAARAGPRRRRRHARRRLRAHRHAGRCPARREQETRHFTGRVRLARECAPAPQRRRTPEPPRPGGRRRPRRRSTASTSTAPPTRCSGSAWRENGARGRHARRATCRPTTSRRRRRPSSCPRLIELCFQTAGVWELGTDRPDGAADATSTGSCGYAGADEPGPLWAVVTPRDGGADADVVDEDGRVRVRLEGYRTIELPGGSTTTRSRRCATAMADR